MTHVVCALGTFSGHSLQSKECKRLIQPSDGKGTTDLNSR